MFPPLSDLQPDWSLCGYPTGKYLLSQKETLDPEWGEHMLDYKQLKEQIKVASQSESDTGGGAAYSPRETSLSVLRLRSDRRARLPLQRPAKPASSVMEHANVSLPFLLGAVSTMFG